MATIVPVIALAIYAWKMDESTELVRGFFGYALAMALNGVVTSMVKVIVGKYCTTILSIEL